MSEISTLADRLAIIDVITKMFVYTDQKRWEDLAAEVFTPSVDFDGGFGGPVGERAAADIIADWRTGLADLDGVHHQSGNHLIDLNGDTARVHADAIAVHVKNAAVEGKTRTFRRQLLPRRRTHGGRVAGQPIPLPPQGDRRERRPGVDAVRAAGDRSATRIGFAQSSRVPLSHRRRCHAVRSCCGGIAGVIAASSVAFPAARPLVFASARDRPGAHTLIGIAATRVRMPSASADCWAP